MYHQRQAMLRNAANPESSIMTLMYLLWAWRKSPLQGLARFGPVLTAAFIFLVGFAVASGFSATVTAGIENEVLVDGRNCAVFNQRAAVEIKQQNYTKFVEVLPTFIGKLIENWSNYAQQCYNRDLGTAKYSLGMCGTFVQRQLPYTINRRAICPFNPAICKSQNRNLLIDSGLLDSHIDFGINAPQSQRFQYRRVLHCAPIKTSGYTTRLNVTADQSLTMYNYGRDENSVQGNTSHTYSYSNDGIDRRSYFSTAGSRPDYTIG
jgi:hypothetical protein